MTTQDMRFKRVKPSLKMGGWVGKAGGKNEKTGGSQLRAERS